MRSARLHTLPYHPPATALQRRLWLTSQYARDTPAYILAYAWQVDGPFDPAAFHAALTAVTGRHEALRTTFTLREGELLRVIHPELPPGFDLLDSVAASDVPELARQEATTRFDLDRGPLLRCRVLRHAPQRHTVLLTTHHITVDGRAMSIVREELAACYEAFLQQRPDPLPPVHRQFADFAAWQQEGLDTGRFDPQMAYWKQQLAGITGPARLPFLKPRPTVRTSEGRWEDIFCDASLTAAARRLAVGARTSVSTVLIAAAARWLAEETGLGEAVIGMSTAGRSLPEFDRLVGLSTNTLPLRIPVQPAATGRLLDVTRSVMLAAIENQDVSFPLLMQELGLPRTLPVNPLTQVLFALRDGLGRPFQLAGAEVTALPAAGLSSSNDVTVELDPRPDGTIRGGLLYSPALIDPPQAARLAAGLVGVLERMTAQPRPAGAVPPGRTPEPSGFPDPGPATVPAPSSAPAGIATAPVSADASAVRPADGDPAVRQQTRRLWRRLLDTEAPADGDDFFAAGGDSLLAAELMLLLGEELDCSLPLNLPVGSPTFGRLVAAVTEHRRGEQR
ncbi:condensation domain-containing protein [Streptomyces sp. NPDC001606]